MNASMPERTVSDALAGKTRLAFGSLLQLGQLGTFFSGRRALRQWRKAEAKCRAAEDAVAKSLARPNFMDATA